MNYQTLIVVRVFYRVFIHNHKNKLMLFLEVEKNNVLYVLATLKITRVLY
jgi:hypothetical protein